MFLFSVSMVINSQSMPKQSIHEVYSFSASHLFGKVYVGNLEAAQSLEVLRNNNIKAIVTAAKNHKLNHSNLDLPDYLYLPALDHSNFDLTIYFQQSSAFIHKCLKYTNVLVHCVAGISRSATIAAAYLMKVLEVSSSEIVQMIQAKREIVDPNPGFRLQLRFYESRLKQERRQVQMVKKLEQLGIDKRKVITQSSPPITLHNPIILAGVERGCSRQKPSHSRRLSLTGSSNRSSHHPAQQLIKRGVSLDKLKYKNLKLQSNKKSFQKMIENNKRRVEERLSKILTISNI